MTNISDLKLEGMYRLTACRPDGTERELAGWFSNLILDGGLNRLGTGGVWDRCDVGSGVTPVSFDQTKLAAIKASSTTVASSLAAVDENDYLYAFAIKTFTFPAGSVVGNLSEVGVGWAGGNLFSRALISDTHGEPTVITVLADEALTVQYQVRVWPSQEDRIFDLAIAGDVYTFTVAAICLSGNNDGVDNEWPVQLFNLLNGGAVSASATASAGAMTAYSEGVAFAGIDWIEMSGGTKLALFNTSGNVASFVSAYVDGSYQRKVRNTFGPSAGAAPFAGILVCTICGDYQMLIDPPIPKDNTNTLTLDYTIGWARKAF